MNNKTMTKPIIIENVDAQQDDLNELCVCFSRSCLSEWI